MIGLAQQDNIIATVKMKTKITRLDSRQYDSILTI